MAKLMETTLRRRLGLVLAAVLLGAAVLPASALASPNLGRQGTKTAPVTVHCWWDANAGLYDVLWTVSPDVIVAMEGNDAPEFQLWAAASGKASAPSVFLATWFGFFPSYSYYEFLDVSGPEWPAGYIRVQATVSTLSGNVVLASGVAKCQHGDIGSP